MSTLPAFLYSVTIDRALATIRTRVPGFSGMRPGERVLDVCCGTGAQVLCYASRGILSWGIDLDSGMIKFAEKRKNNLGLSSASFQMASATDLPFKDGAFDHASICMGLHEKEGAARDGTIAEMRRVVKKDGSLCIIDYRVPLPQNAYGCAVRIVERLAGQSHFGCFGEFEQAGGLDPLLRRHYLVAEKWEYSKRMPLMIVKLRNSQDSLLHPQSRRDLSGSPSLSSTPPESGGVTGSPERS
jgi:ubiquinone/menaquinone biosynthesis C-methylase UbiE